MLKFNNKRMKGFLKFVFCRECHFKNVSLTFICGVFFVEHVLNKDETTKNSDGLTIKEVPSLEINEDQVSQPYHDVPYFRFV